MQTVSVAMATYNGALYLQTQLDSIENQKITPDELIVVDDMSSDETMNILRAFQGSSKINVRIFQNERNVGVKATFERCLSICSGQYIFLSDQDDYWNANKIETIISEFANEPSDWLIIHDGQLADRDLNRSEFTKLGQLRSGGYRDKAFCTGALTALDRRLLTLALPFPECAATHDGWLHYVAGTMAKRRIVAHVLQLVRRHDSNASSWAVNNLRAELRPLDVLMAGSRKPAAADYTDRGLQVGIMEARLATIDLLGPYLLDKYEIAAARRRLKTEAKAIEHRQSLVSLNRAWRCWEATRMLSSGRYEYFSGLSSYLRDVLR